MKKLRLLWVPLALFLILLFALVVVNRDLVGEYLLLLICFNYLSAVSLKADPLEPSSEGCKPCQRVKPARAHHCSKCQKCTLLMDHHCPWINGCVGFHNQRYFYLTLVYIWIGTLYYLAAYSTVFDSWFRDSLDWSENFGLMFVFTYLLAAAIQIPLFFLLIRQSFLLATGQTLLEWHVHRSMRASGQGHLYANLYDLGTLKNIQVFFNTASHPWWYALLPIPVPPAGNGHEFQTADDLYDDTQSP